MVAQMSHFIGTTGALWMKGELEMKPAGVFTSTGTIHGGQESTILTSFVPLMHLGMVIVGTSYGENPAHSLPTTASAARLTVRRRKPAETTRASPILAI